MTQVVRPQFGYTPALSAYTPAPYDGFEPIIIDLSRRRMRRRVMAFFRQTLILILLAAIVALGGFGFYYANNLPERQTPTPEEKPPAPAQITMAEIMGPPVPTAEQQYFIPAPAPSVPAPLPERNVPASPEAKLPPIPRDTLSPQAAALIPILKTLPVGRELYPTAKRKNRRNSKFHSVHHTPASARFNISVIQDTAQEQHDRFVNQADQAAQQGERDNAIKYYSAALRAKGGDRDAAYNLASLLLQKAAVLDNHGQQRDALDLYERAFKVWNEDDALAHSITQRMAWIKQKLPPKLVTPKFSDLGY